MSIGVWVDQGVVIAPVSADQPGQPTVLYEANPVILSANPDGKIFKMIFGSANGACYAESNNGISWTRYGSNPIVAFGAHDYPQMTKIGSTYYLYDATAAGPIGAYTASAMNGPYTLQNANAIVRTQTWETNGGFNFIGQLNIAGQIAGTYYGYYSAFKPDNQYSIGQATSTDLINWTKNNAANPVITYGTPGSLDFHLINNVYYGWTQIVQPGIPNNNNFSIPSDVCRFSSTSPAGPFTPLPVCASYRTTTPEGVGTVKGQWADPCLVEANGNVYIYTSIAVDGSTAATQVGCALASNTTIANLIAGYEGMFNIPIPWGTSTTPLQLSTLATDTFQRADANPIGGNWTQLYTGASFSPSQLASNTIEGSVAGNNSDSYWNAISWPNDQWVSIKVAALTDANCYAGINLRSTPGAFASANGYRIYVKGPFGVGAKYAITKYVNGTFSNLVAETTLTVSANDIITVSVIGNQISFYQNGNLITTLSDSSQTSGQAGVLNVPSAGAGVAGSRISSFSGGGTQVPLLPSTGAAFDILFKGRLYVTRVVSGL